MTDNNRPLLWRKPLQALQDGVLNSVGYPATLRRRIDNGALEIKKPQRQDTIWLRSIVIWQSWEYRALRQDSASPLCDALRSWVSQGLSHNQAFWEAAK